MTDSALPIAEPVPDSPAAPKPFVLPLPGLFVFLACLALALLCNFASLRGENFIGAERDLIANNDLLNRLPGLQAIWFRGTTPDTYPLPQYAPLAQTMFFVEHALWGDVVWPYRLVSIVLHALVGLMVWRVLRSLAMPGAIAVALLFVTHPTTVDSVSWVAERRVPLAALLSLSGVYLFLRASAIVPASTGKLKLLPDDPMRLYGMGAALMVLALFSSPALAATVPLVVLLIAWWKHHKPDAKLAGACVALLVAGVAMLGWSSTVEKARSGMLSPNLWSPASSAAGDLAVRTQIAGRAVGFYAAKLSLPYPVSVNYARWQTPRDVEQFRTYTTDPTRVNSRKADVAPGNVVAYAFPLAVLAVLIASWILCKQLGRGQFLAVAGFVLLLAPSLGFIDLGWMRHSYVANQAMYLACVPFFAGIVWLVDLLLSKANDRTVNVATAGLVVAVFTVLCAATVAPRFANASRFWLDNANAIKSSPAPWWPRYELGWSLLEWDLVHDVAAYRQAAQAAEEVRRLKPDEPGALVLVGKLRQIAGQEVDAVRAFEASITTFPSYARAYFELADSFRIQADRKPTDPLPRREALRYFSEAAERDPLDAYSEVNVGRAAWEIAKRLDPANPQIDKLVDMTGTAFNRAVDLRPYDVNLLITMARTLTEMGKLADASSLLESARTIAPNRDDVYEAIGDALLARRPPDTNGADAALGFAIKLNDKNVRARLALGGLRVSQERWREARALFEEVLKIDPDNAEAKKRLTEVETSATTRPESTTRPASGPAGNTVAPASRP